VTHLWTVAFGLVLATFVALAAWRAGALSGSGAVAAGVTGFIAVGAGWGWAIVLITYFVASSALSRLGRREKAIRTAGRIAKAGPRDATQVLANGGLFVIAAGFSWVTNDAVWALVGAGALAASSADTWATELGTLAAATPRSILTGRPVATGTSGGVTSMGLLAALGGAGLVALVARAVGWSTAASGAALIGGIAGCLVDSMLGASVQGRFWCASCDAPTESRVHTCGATTRRTGGLTWLDNDGVNAASTVAGAVVALAAASYF
jgi:uncharacterized protein (TIGR00297 family)